MSDRQREQRRPPKGLRYVVYVGLGLVVLMMVALAGAVFLGGSGPAAPDIPATSFSYDYYENETLQVSLADGATLNESNTERLVVVAEGSVQSNFTLPVEAGDRVELSGVANGSRVQVIWFSPDGSDFPIDRRTVSLNESAG